MSDSIYAFDPDADPDTQFVPGELRHLALGNHGRLLDARRTPVRLTAIIPQRGAFEVEICAFEDVGARWELPVEDVERFQFARGSALAPERLVDALRQAIERFNHPLEIDVDPDARQATLRQLAAERLRIGAALRSHGFADLDVAHCVATREGDPRLFAVLDSVLRERELDEIERRFSSTFVSNPRSGEAVKGHAIVLAELGLCPFRGTVTRDPDVFAGGWSKEHRARHILARAAFTQELWKLLGFARLTLFRAAAVDGPLPPTRPMSFVSTTLSDAVADEHFRGGPRTEVAVLWRQAVPLARLFMTFLETMAMNRQFKEAEVVVFGDPANRAF